MGDKEKVTQLSKYLLGKLKSEYDDRQTFWHNDRIYFEDKSEFQKIFLDSSSGPAHNFYKIVESEYLPAIINQDTAQVNALISGTLKNLYTDHRAHIDEVVSRANQKNKDLETFAAGQISQRTFGLIILLCTTLLISITIFVIVLFQIQRSLKALTGNIKDIADGEGDLTQRISLTSNDELGTMSRYFNLFIDKLQGTIRHVVSNADTVATSAASLSVSSKQLADNSESIQLQTGLVSSAVEQAASDVSTISSAVNEMSSSINSVASAIDQINASLNEVAKNCHNEVQIVTEAGEQARNGKEVMDRLGASAKSIEKVVGLINTIADQINLLSLNAAIEASSAGEAGKGFAVVANEVKELARQTALATKEIEVQIETMQENTNAAMRSIDVITKVIEDVASISSTIVSAVEEQSITMHEISKDVMIVNSGAQEVTQSVQGSALGLSKVTTTMTEVKSAIGNSSTGISEINQSSDKLATLSGSLKEVVGQFKI
jgi:methyl-accepting chemotaxis protein